MTLPIGRVVHGETLHDILAQPGLLSLSFQWASLVARSGMLSSWPGSCYAIVFLMCGPVLRSQLPTQGRRVVDVRHVHEPTVTDMVGGELNDFE